MMGSVTSGLWAARNAVVLKVGSLRSDGAGWPLNRSGATVRKPARANESARLGQSVSEVCGGAGAVVAAPVGCVELTVGFRSG